MLHLVLHAAFAVALPHYQESVVPPHPRLPLPRPVANAKMATINQNRVPAGRLSRGTLTLSLDVVEAAWQPEGPADPVVRILALAEPGKAPEVPGPLLRAPVGTTVRLTLRNRSDSAVMFSGFRRQLAAKDDTVQLAAGATRDLTFRLDSVGTHFYWGVLKGLTDWRQRDWLDSQLTGAFVVDPAGARVDPRERIWVVTEWFHPYPDRVFESALVFNGRAWPHNERLTFAQGDSLHWRLINVAAIEHPMHLHGFYFRMTRRGGDRGDTAIAPSLQPLQNVQLMRMGGTMSISWVVSTPGNWVFHCHLASHVGEAATLHGSPDPHLAHGATAAATPAAKAAEDHSAPGGHSMRGLVIGMHVTPSAGYREPVVKERRTIRLLAQNKPHVLAGNRTAYGFVLQSGDSVPKRDEVKIPGPVIELRRGEPVRLVVKNNLNEEFTGVHWHGLEIESYPDGVPGFSGMGTHITPAIAPGDSFVAEFTPPRSGTYPYHAHLHELRQIGSGMYGALIVSDAPRDTTKEHVVVAGGGGLPMFPKLGPAFLLVNGSRAARPLRMTVGDTNRLRIVSIHSDEILKFRLGTDSTVARWRPIALDGADLPDGLRGARTATAEMGPGTTADFAFVPDQVGTLTLEVWTTPVGTRVVLPIVVGARVAAAGTR